MNNCVLIVFLSSGVKRSGVENYGNKRDIVIPLFIHIIHKKRSEMEMCALFGYRKKSFVTILLLYVLNVLYLS
jgi:hypothetical protein